MYLYILSEDDNDDIFYKGCVEKITGKTFELIPRRMRKGGGLSQVRKYMPHLLKEIQYTGFVEDTFFVIALDNDRSPVHPEHKQIPQVHKLPAKEQKQNCRFCEIEKIANEILGKNREEWPIKGAIAVPVQMIESWLLLICNREKYQTEAKLPVFAKQDSESARYYHAPKKPDRQLKDLCFSEKQRLNILSSPAFCRYCAENLLPEKLQEISGSFELFQQQLCQWFMVS